MVPPVVHVVHVIDGLGLGGAERMLVDIANATARDGHRVTVCITRDNTLQRAALDERIEILVLGRKRRLDVAPTARFIRWVRSNAVDVLHVHMRSSLSFMLALRLLRLIRTPIVFHDHYGTIEIDPSVPRWFRAGRRMIDQYVGVYERLTEWAIGAGVDRSRAITIANALDLTRLQASRKIDLRAELAIPRDRVLAILVATVRRDKGIEMLVEAVSRMTPHDRLQVLLVGGEPDPAYAAECRALVAKLGLETSITFVGPRSDVPGLLECADIGLLSSHTESGPLVLVEYLAAGLPIVATTVGNIGRSLERAGVPGFVAPRDVAGFARALEEVVELASEARRARGAIGKALITKEWDIQAAMPAWYSAYARAGARPSP